MSKILLLLCTVVSLYAVANADIPVYCNQGGAINGSDFNTLINALRSQPFDDAKNEILFTFCSNLTRGFNANQTISVLLQFKFSKNMVNAIEDMSKYILGLFSSQVADILETFPFSSDRLSVLPIIMNAVTDPENKEEIVQAFRFQSDKDHARMILAGMRPRSCVFGIVTEKRVQFLIDVSGSMAVTFVTNTGKKYTRLQFVVEQLDLVIRQQLQQDQSLNIFQFANSASSWKPGLVPVTDENVNSAVAYINSLRANGGTNISGALDRAFTDPNVVAVYLLTDGFPNTGLTDQQQLVNLATKYSYSRTPNVPIHCVAFLSGEEPGADKNKARSLMEAIATATGGVYRSIE